MKNKKFVSSRILFNIVKKAKLTLVKMFKEGYCAPQIAGTACAHKRGLAEAVKLLEQNKKRAMK